MGTGQTGQQIVVGLYHIVLHVAGDVDAGDLVLVALHEGQDLGLRLVLGHRQGGVDIDLVGGGDLVEHHLEGLQIGQRLAAGEHKVAVGRDGIHPPDALTDLLGGKGPSDPRIRLC